MASLLDRPILPDLVLRVRHTKSQEGCTFKYRLDVHNRYIGLPLGEEDFPVWGLQGDFEAKLAQEMRGIEDLRDEEKAIAEEFLFGFGVNLADWLFPEPLRQRFWNLHSKTLALTLLIDSDETFIPWELIRLSITSEVTSRVDSRFLVEGFAVTRWCIIGPKGPALELPLSAVGVIAPADSELEAGAHERAFLGKFFTGIDDLPTQTLPLIDALASGRYDALHFAGHGLLSDSEYPEREGRNPERMSLRLDSGEQLLPRYLADRARSLGRRRPWVFLNACHSARGLYALNSLGGFATAFLKADAGALIGTHWAVRDESAAAFAQALYDYFGEGLPLGEAVRKARIWFSKKYPGDPSFLAYVVYGHPLAVRNEASTRWSIGDNLPIKIPRQTWHSEQGDSALLRAQFGVVPYHGRSEEHAEILGWCTSSESISLRLLTGAGGMGKTRMLIELAKDLEDRGWLAGFLTEGEADRAPILAWEALVARDKPLFLVVDYAETRRDLLVPLIRGMLDLENERRLRVRVVLLARAAFDWWEQLKWEGDGVGEFLRGPVTSQNLLRPLANEATDRNKTFGIAEQRFCEVLDKKPLVGQPPSLTDEIFERVLFIHMAALMRARGITVSSRDAILDAVLDRERKVWQKLAAAAGLPKDSEFGFGRAMAALTLGGGASTRIEALSALQELKYFSAMNSEAVEKFLAVLHDCYPGERLFIAPLEPDLLGEHLVHRELERDSEDILDLVFR